MRTLEVAKNYSVAVISADEFAKVKKLPFNREANYRRDLANSMNEYGWIGSITIVKTAAFGSLDDYLLDGHHRGLTASALGIPILVHILHYQPETVADLVKLTAAVNSSQKKWVPMDYVRSYSYLNYPDYITLIAITATCPFTVTAVASMLHGYRSKGRISTILESGEFKVNLLEETKYSLDLAAKLSKYGRMSSRMALALHYVASLKNFKEEKFVNAYIKNYQIIRDLRLDDYSDIFQSWL